MLTDRKHFVTNPAPFLLHFVTCFFKTLPFNYLRYLCPMTKQSPLTICGETLYAPIHICARVNKLFDTTAADIERLRKTMQ